MCWKGSWAAMSVELGYPITRNTLRSRLAKYARFKYTYLMLLPVLAYYAIFHYGPIYGAIIAFKDYSPFVGITASPWVGFRHFIDFFNSYYFWRVVRNTILINLLDLILHFPAPVILALLLNEVRNQFYKRTVQTATYMPHFISVVVVAGMVIQFSISGGLFNELLKLVGLKPQAWLNVLLWYPFLYVGSSIWQQVGWGSIIFLAALSNIDPQLYESAVVDGAGRFKQMLHITLPGIAPTFIIVLILRMGRMMSVGLEKTILLANPQIYEIADIIQFYVYRRGLLEMNFSHGAAVGLFNSVINFSLLYMTNQISRRVSETSLW